MKELVNMLAGGKNSTATGRAVVYSAFGTAIALILVIAILVVSSVAFAVIDATTPNLEEDLGGEKEPVIVSIEYTTLEDISVLKSKLTLSKMVNVREKRSVLDADNDKLQYYATMSKDTKLPDVVADALDDMLVAFYKANEKVIKTDTAATDENGKKTCNIPVVNAQNEEFVLTAFNNDTVLISENPIYSWILTNAHKYGFIHQNGSFRYVGVAVATQAKTFAGYETFLNSVKGSTAGAEMSLGRTYKAYYVAADATEIKVPSNLGYEVFADGIAGYIVVVKTSK